MDALINAYQKRRRKPRLEYVAKLAPAVEEVLTSAGFSVEGRLPLMICVPGSEQLLPIPLGIELSDAEILATVMVQNEAYGASPLSLEDAQRLRNSIVAGAIAVLACVAATGEPVGAGVCSVPENQMTEIAGIGVRIAFRRQGIAGALTTRLVQEAFGAGVTTTFLMAAHEAERRIYTRAGFTPIGKILHISLPLKL
ncbi:MAG: GNAT family N-acetyltransferase [Rhizonema sp. PD38]|nr:GNAT family N-acetyltransferase [Rhizonema sp. PD38]